MQINSLILIILFIPFIAISNENCHTTQDIKPNELYLSVKCKNKECLELNKKFEEKTKVSLSEKIFVPFQIESIEVKQPKRTENPYILLTGKTKSPCQLNDFNQLDSVIVHRHQIIANVISPKKANQNRLVSKMTFSKNITLREANEICLQYSKKCKWISTLNEF